jgi:hypothetical protein
VISQAGNFGKNLVDPDDMREVFDLRHIGKKVNFGGNDPFRFPEDGLDEPGAGGTPHSFNLEGEMKRRGRKRGDRLFFRQPPLIQLGMGPGNDARLNAVPIKICLSEIRGHSIRMVAEDLINPVASRAAEAERFPADLQLRPGFSDRQAAEITGRRQRSGIWN